ncbi:MAG: hypothetical protein KF900_00105 [Bacteroidetes bacterium]|nr:hypothetical protein [Bacteroidota bacterium]
MSSEERLKYLLRKLIGSKEFPFSERNWQKMKAMLPDNEVSGEAQFKTSLNKLVEEKEFAFAESSWEKMSAILPERERKNRLVPILWTLAGLLVVGSFLVVSLKSEVAEVQSLKSEVESKELKVENQKLAVKKQETANNKQHTEQKSNEIVVKEKTVSSEKPLLTDVQQTEKELVKETQEISVPDVVMPVVTNAIENKEEEETSYKSEVVSQQLVEKINEQLQVGNEQSATDKLSNFQNFGIFQQQDSTKQETELEASSQSAENGQQAAIGKTEHDTTKQETINEQPAISELSNFQNFETLKQETTIELPKKIKKPFMYFEAGGAYLLGWKNAGKREGNGFNPVVGFNYYNYLNEKLALSLGAQYTSVNNLSNYNNTSKKTTRYSFGEESQVTVITPQKVHYLLVPIKLHYFLDSSNSFGAGFNAAYLLTVGGTMEIYDVRLNKQENYKSGKVNGYTEGFNTFDTQVSVFYRRRLHKNIGVVAELFYGISDIKNNLFFNSSVKEKNKGLKLTLTYTVFK